GIPALSLHVNPVESELRGEEGSDVAVVVKQHDGQLVSHLIRREPVDFDIPIEWRLLDSGIGYIRIYNFSNQERINQFREAYSKLKDTPGLIIDVRGPNGGKPSVVGSILGYFIDRVEMMTFRDRQGRGFKSYTVPQKKLYQGKLAVVIDERSRSGQEIFANTLKEHARAIIIGTRSCGCVEGGNYVRLGENEELEIAHYAVVTPKHGKLEDTGVQPDHVVPITEKDIITGRDPQIRAAEQELLVESVN
ncbi:MAG TPA: S41 family peptidase, partial [Blastocatellia bacterium]|nr:S41 family peptidase [Blastocatellia bacterium]